MKINSLKIQNYRNHEKREFDLKYKTILIQGSNGSGKTNILEAIHLLSTTKSVRAEYDLDMIMHTKDFCKLEAQTDLDEAQTKLELTIKKNSKFENTSNKTVKINGVAKALYKFAGRFTSVLFTPDDISMLTGSPSIRRKYIDSILYQTDSEYKQAHLKYQKALKGRNKLLEMIRETGKGDSLIELWEENLCNEAVIIQDKRLKLFNYLKEEIKKYEKLINGRNSKIHIDFIQSVIDTNFLKQSRQKEIYAGKTLYGPHRDDFNTYLNDYLVASFASRGQQRAVLLALKFCEIDYIQVSTGTRPILLLDDIFSELDQIHRTNIISVMAAQQTIVTSSETLPDIKHEFDSLLEL